MANHDVDDATEALWPGLTCTCLDDVVRPGGRPRASRITRMKIVDPTAPRARIPAPLPGRTRCFRCCAPSVKPSGFEARPKARGLRVRPGGTGRVFERRDVGATGTSRDGAAGRVRDDQDYAEVTACRLTISCARRAPGQADGGTHQPRPARRRFVASFRGALPDFAGLGIPDQPLLEHGAAC